MTNRTIDHISYNAGIEADKASLLRTMCNAGERCSCADNNFQWRSNTCDLAIAYADRIIAASRSLPPQWKRADFAGLPNTPAPADAERLALADQEENIAKTIHSTRQKFGFGGSALWEHEPPQIKALHRETAKAVIDSIGARGLALEKDQFLMWHYQYLMEEIKKHGGHIDDEDGHVEWSK